MCVPMRARPQEPLESSRTGEKPKKPSWVNFSTIGRKRRGGILNWYARICSGKLVGALNLIEA